MLRLLPRALPRAVLLSSTRHLRSAAVDDRAPSAKVEQIVRSTTGFGACPSEDDFDPGLVAARSALAEQLEAGQASKAKAVYLNWEEVSLDDSFAASEAFVHRRNGGQMLAGK